MIIGIDMGHSLSGPGTGATGLMVEVEKNREAGKLLIEYLIKKDHKVVNCTVDKANSQNEQLAAIVSKANAQYLDCFVSLHLNSHNDTNANGTETYIWNGVYDEKEVTREFAKRVNDEVSNSCNFMNRGVKEYDFYVCRNTKAMAILVEICFCTSEIDKIKWDSEKIAKALFKSITQEEYIEQTEQSWIVGDLFKIHGNVKKYVGGDTISPYDYIYEITDISGAIVSFKPTYTPELKLRTYDIYKLDSLKIEELSKKMKKSWSIGDNFRIHGNVKKYAGGDTISPYDYIYEITNLEGDVVSFKPTYLPELRLTMSSIY